MGKIYFKFENQAFCTTPCPHLPKDEDGIVPFVGSVGCNQCKFNEDILFPHPEPVDDETDNDDYVECAKQNES